MKKLNELIALRASKIEAQQTLVNGVEDRNLSKEENTKFDGLQSEIEGLNKEIERAEKFAENQKRMASVAGTPVGEVKEEREVQPFSFLRAINNVIDGKAHEGEEKRAFDECKNELNESNKTIQRGHQVAIPNDMLIARDITVDGDSGTKGGKLVASTPQVIMPLLPSLKLADMGAKTYPGLVGDLPLISGDEFTFAYVAENGAVSSTDVVYDGPTLTPKRLSGVVDVSNKWLVQTGAAVEANLRALIGAGIEAAMVRNAIAGPGTEAPTGLYDAITTNVQAGAAGAPTWEDVVGLETLIKSANASDGNLAYFSDPALMGKLKTTLKASGVAGYIHENGMLNGRKHTASTLVGTLDVGVSHPLIYGDWAQMAIGFWGGITFQVDPLTQAASGKTRLIFNLYNDIAIANEKAFAIRNNFTV